jgi:hypothetical protein
MLRSAANSATHAFCKNKYAAWASLLNVKVGGTYSSHRSVFLLPKYGVDFVVLSSNIIVSLTIV